MPVVSIGDIDGEKTVGGANEALVLWEGKHSVGGALKGEQHGSCSVACAETGQTARNGRLLGSERGESGRGGRR